MATASAVVEQVGSKDRTTRFGVKKVYSFKAGGTWYDCGFKNPNVVAGQAIQFEFEVDQYGNKVDVASIGMPVPGAAAPTPAAAAPTPISKGAAPVNSSYGTRVFPIPALDASRAINRQNALTNARELIECFVHPGDGTPDWNIEFAVQRIIETARMFEAYTCGDLDMQEVEEEEAAKAKKAA
jgi:hypothetical protein